MAEAELLRDGSLRYRAGDCCFVFTRVRPGVLLTSIFGYDSGELGRAPLEAVEAEYSRFQLPIEWFIDASGVSNARNPVFQQWTSWLNENRSKLKRVAVLTGTRPAHLTISIARHLSNTDTLMTIYEDGALFLNALRTGVASSEAYVPVQMRANEPAIDVIQNRERDGTWRIRTQSAEISFRLAGRSLISTFAGPDIDVLATPSMDAAVDQLAAGQPVTWFADLRTAEVSKELMDSWTQWILAHRAFFTRIAILTNRGAFPLILNIVNYRSGMGDLVKVYSDCVEYERVMTMSAAV